MVIMFLDFILVFTVIQPLLFNTNNFYTISCAPTIFYILFKHFIHFIADLPNNTGRRWYSQFTDEKTGY